MIKRKALVTGAAKGIGRAIAEIFQANGIEVFAPSHVELNLSLDKSVDDYLAKSKVEFDILVNNAGINPLAETLDIADRNIDEVLRVNLVSPLRLIRAVAPQMIKNGYGRILNISSIWSLVAKPGRGLYSISKAGLNSLTRSTAIEFAKYNILVNAIAPGLVATELTRKNLSAAEIKNIISQIPLGRLARPAEIAAMALFLCSDRNSYLTGQTIVVDGGYTCL